MTSDQRPGQRCGWCIDGLHDNCVVVVMCGESRSRDHKKSTGPYPWQCKCWTCRPHEGPQDYCVDCKRRGVTVSDYRCTDKKACQRARDRARKKEKAA